MYIGKDYNQSRKRSNDSDIVEDVKELVNKDNSKKADKDLERRTKIVYNASAKTNPKNRNSDAPLPKSKGTNSAPRPNTTSDNSLSPSKLMD